MTAYKTEAYIQKKYGGDFYDVAVALLLESEADY